MKNLSLILASLVLFAGVSFASPITKKGVKQEKTEKKEVKKDEKKAETKPAAKRRRKERD